eukprot:gi/632970320/ref/XP_007901583.1/ PREDICTED: uncharacterized protein LOC103185059 [Callorhinchus milii]
MDDSQLLDRSDDIAKGTLSEESIPAELLEVISKELLDISSGEDRSYSISNIESINLEGSDLSDVDLWEEYNSNISDTKPWHLGTTDSSRILPTSSKVLPGSVIWRNAQPGVRRSASVSQRSSQIRSRRPSLAAGRRMSLSGSRRTSIVGSRRQSVGSAQRVSLTGGGRSLSSSSRHLLQTAGSLHRPSTSRYASKTLTVSPSVRLSQTHKWSPRKSASHHRAQVSNLPLSGRQSLLTADSQQPSRVNSFQDTTLSSLRATP